MWTAGGLVISSGRVECHLPTYGTTNCIVEREGGMEGEREGGREGRREGGREGGGREGGSVHKHVRIQFVYPLVHTYACVICTHRDVYCTCHEGCPGQ